MTQPDVPIVTPPVELTAESRTDLEDACARHAETGAVGVVVDLDEVKLITSAGLGRLVRIGQSLDAAGGLLTLARGRRRVVKLIYTVGLDAVMPHFPSVEEAQAFVREARDQDR